MGGCSCARGCGRAGAGVSRRGHGCGRVLAGVYVGIRVGAGGVPACGRMGVLVSVFSLVETLYFLVFLFFLLIPVTVSITRATTQFTLITAHHDWIPSQPYGFCFLFFFFLSPCRDFDPTWTPTATWRCRRTCSPIKRQRAGIFAAGKHGFHPVSLSKKSVDPRHLFPASRSVTSSAARILHQSRGQVTL